MPGPASWSHGICVTRVLLQFCPLDFSVCQRYVQVKDQGSDLPTQAFSKNGLDIFIAKSSGTRHLQGLTARSGNSFNSNLKSRGRNSHRGVTTRGKHTNHHADFACLLQLLPRMRLQENIAEGSAVSSEGVVDVGCSIILSGCKGLVSPSLTLSSCLPKLMRLRV